MMEELETLVHVVESGSLTLAAEELSLSQSAVTKRLRRLEIDLGQRLVDRLPTHALPTAAGRVVYRHARRILAEASAMRSDITSLLEPGSGIVRVAAVDTMAVFALPSLLTEFRLEHPHVRVRARVGSVRESADLVLRGEVDLGLCTVPVDDPRLITWPLFFDPVQIVATPEVAHALPDPVTMRDLEGVGVVTYPEGSRFRSYVDSSLEQHGLTLPVSMEFDSHEAVRTMALLGHGVAVVPHSAVSSDVAAGRLVSLHVDRVPAMGRTAVLLVRRDAVLLPSAEAFVARIRKRYPGGATSEATTPAGRARLGTSAVPRGGEPAVPREARPCPGLEDPAPGPRTKPS